MPLNIEAAWSRPFTLSLNGDGPIYSCENLLEIPTTEGAYIFGRQRGENLYPLYIGQASNLQVRVGQHLNSAKLMMGLLKAPSGGRFVIVCEVKFKRRQNHKAVLSVLEAALISHALAEGHELLQVQGTRRPSHLVKFTGNRQSERLVPRLIRISKR